MPKETVTTHENWRLSVSWSREGYAQVGASTLEDTDGGQFFSLNRDEINHMIRALRKARDQAFGADA